MAVTVAQVATMLHGIPNGKVAPLDGYYFFRTDEIWTTTITMRIGQCTRYCQEQKQATTQAAKPLLFDDLVLAYTCYRVVVEDVMGSIMTSGFSFTSIELTINNSSNPEVITKTAKAFELRTKELLMALKARVAVFEQTQYGADPYAVDSTYFPQTSNWRY